MGATLEPSHSASRTRRDAIQSGGAAVIAAAGFANLRRKAAAQEAATPETASGVPPDFKVVLHAAQVENWPFVLSNLRNLAQQWPRAHVRVVADGSAVIGLQGENVLTRELAGLAAQGIQVLVCPNALHDQGIPRDAIPAFAEVRLGGVVELVIAQRDGFAYVKP